MSRNVRVADGVELCAELMGADLPGDAGAPALLLIGGATWSMDGWEDDLCALLVARGRQVLRYDQRDTGESTTWPVGAPGYSGADLVSDAVALLDAFGIEQAHVVGLSMGGAIAQRLAIEHRDRVATLTLVSTTPVDPGVTGLPGPSPALQVAPAAEPDWEDRESAVDALVEGERPYAGPGTFDEPRARALAGRVFDRSRDLAARTNHFLLPDGPSTDLRLARLAGLPTLVLHGTADPLFPPAHGRALAAAIPGARLVELDGVGHQLPPPHTWDVVVDALVAHTA